jgi:hypothetical protein
MGAGLGCEPGSVYCACCASLGAGRQAHQAGRKRTADGGRGRFWTENGGLKYACELLRVRLILAMVNIAMNKGVVTCWGVEAGDHDVSQ